MPGNYVRWTDEMKEELVALYRRNFAPLEIAERLGVSFESVQYAVKSAKKGKWGADYKARVLFQDPPPEPSAASEDTSAEIAEETSCQQVSESHNDAASELVETEETTAETSYPPINMISAIDELTACAQLFGSDEITGLFAAPRTGVAQISFRIGSSEYLLELKEVTDN